MDVGVAVGEALDHALDGLLGAVRIAGDAVADLHDGAPVLRREIFVRRLGCTLQSDVSRRCLCVSVRWHWRDVGNRGIAGGAEDDVPTASSYGPGAAALNMVAAGC